MEIPYFVEKSFGIFHFEKKIHVQRTFCDVVDKMSCNREKFPSKYFN